MQDFAIPVKNKIVAERKYVAKNCSLKNIVHKRNNHNLIISNKRGKMTDTLAKELYYLNKQTYNKMPKIYNNWLFWDEYHNKNTGFSGWMYKNEKESRLGIADFGGHAVWGKAEPSAHVNKVVEVQNF